jgi:hypothetical protein
MAIRGNVSGQRLFSLLLTMFVFTDDQICGACHQKVIVSGKLKQLQLFKLHYELIAISN